MVTPLAERGQALPEVVAARRKLERERLVAQLLVQVGATRPAWSSHFVRPSATVGPAAERATNAPAADVELGGRHGAVDRAPVGRLCPGQLAAEQQHLPGADLADASGQQPRRAAVGREPALGERLPETGVVGRDREVGGQRQLQADARPPTPRTSHTTGACTVEQQRDQPMGLGGSRR